ncbi:MAG: DoxX family membrane protein [Polyangiaceae bacterium]|jgi:putative oxidoreductase
MNDLDVGLLLARLSGLAMAAHGAQKLFGWFGGHGVTGTGVFFEKLGFRPGRLFAFAAGAGETAGGLLVFLGLAGALGPALVVLVMVVAALSVHVKNGFFQSSSGWEMNMLYGAVALALGYVGPGSLSLDSALGLDVLHAPRQVTWSFLAAVVLALLNLAARRKIPAPTGR